MRARLDHAIFSVLTVAALTLPGANARADGDQSHALTFNETAEGLGMTSVGIGLGGRRTGNTPAVPISEGQLALTTLPGNAQIVVAYLYWVVYGSVGDSSVEFGTAPTAITGSLIGTSAHTCWDQFDTTELNRVYRADVTARITGNASYLIRGFPSGTANADAQGASLVVIYEDPADQNMGSVILNDGAITKTSNTYSESFDDVVVTSSTLSATFRLGVGDGQAALSDGTWRFSGTQLPVPAGGHFPGAKGTYWDDRAYDVKGLIQPAVSPVVWSANGGADCLVIAYSGLSLSSEFIDDDGDGIENAFDNCLGLANPEQTNSDGDEFGDACDNCDLKNNKSQLDTDADGAGDVCDNCNDVANPDQLDPDADGWGSLCDNCPNTFNMSQVDTDGDGNGDLCEGGDIPAGGEGGGGPVVGEGGTPNVPSEGGAAPVLSEGGATSAPGKGGSTSGVGLGSGDAGMTTSEGGAGLVSGGGEGAGLGSARPENDAGCACSVVGSPAQGAWLAAFSGFGLALLGLRRRWRHQVSG